MFSNFSPPKNRAIYEIMWKNAAQPDRPQMTMWRMRIASWITKAAATLKPEPTQHNSLDRLQIRKYKSRTLLFMSAATLKAQAVGGDNIPVVSVSV
jgi:hypothetical protein